ncbi:MAG TPA: hypothetical protein VL977_07980 [Solirubrobacteraceae bacterium]|nr:hypothetical protein [Solirubrobacteraceae bacterium]
MPEPRRRKTRPQAATAPGEPISRRERNRLRDEQARAALAPLAPGERPAGLLAAIAVAGCLSLGELVAWLAGATIGGKHPGLEVLAFPLLTGVLAVGMALARYWAVLLFEALLTLIILVFSLFLVEARDLAGVGLCVGVLVPCGWIFWKLIRVMGRIAVTNRSHGADQR